MKFLIENLGPIREAEVELGDITVLLGPPNTGKSYTLKALYSSLLMLDQVAREAELWEVLSKFDIWERHRDYLDDVLHVLQILTIISILRREGIDIESNVAQTIISDLRDITGAGEIKCITNGDTISVSSKKKESIDLKKLSGLFELKNRFLWGILPVNDNTAVTLDSRTPLQEIFKIVSQAVKDPIHQESRYYDRKTNLKISYKVSSKLENEVLKVTKEIGAKWQLENPVLNSIRINLEGLLKDNKKYNRENLIKIARDIFNQFHLFDLPLHMRFRIGRSAVVELERNLVESIGRYLKIAYSEFFRLQAVRFIPFGRSPLVYQLEYFSQEPIFRWKSVEEGYRSDLVFYSYISWLSRGRAILAEKGYDERLVEIFNPVLQGNIKFDKQIKEVKYKRWGYRKEVPIRWASALAGEVTGIFLPILTAPPNSCLIIEEPEAQLHYSAQVLMALALAGLSAEFSHKIVFSSHSDVLAITLAYLKELKPDEKLQDLIKTLLRTQNILARNKAETLVRAASKAKDLDIRFYYYEPSQRGVKVTEKTAKDILEEVPGITDVMDTLASWALNL